MIIVVVSTAEMVGDMLPVPKRLDKYELLKCRYEPGRAVDIWIARDTQLQRLVIIKVLHPDQHQDPAFLARFQREALFMASLHHPNIVQIYDFQVTNAQAMEGDQQYTTEDGFHNSTEQPLAYMVMDYVEGPTLDEYLCYTSRQGRFPSALAVVQLFTSLSLAIDYAHRQDMVHRDIRPANIVLDQSNTQHSAIGEPVLINFGLARLLSSTMTFQSGEPMSPGLVAPDYLSPEQINGLAGDERSDLYALGVLLYEVLTGVLPFQGLSPSELMRQHFNVQPVDPALINPNLTPAVSQILFKALEKDPDQRYGSAAALTIALARALNVPVPEILGRPSNLPEQEQALLPDRFREFSALANRTSLPDVHKPVYVAVDKTLTVPGSVLRPVSGRATFTPSHTILKKSIHSSLKKRYKLYVPLLIGLIMVLVLGSALFVLIPDYLAAHSAVMGHIYYISSGQVGALNSESGQGITDQVKIDLQSVEPPPIGKSYCAWLLGDKIYQAGKSPDAPSSTLSLPLLLTHNLPVNSDGTVHYFYAGTPTHDNLLSVTSRFLLTEEDAAHKPDRPSKDQASWRYFAMISQEATPTDPTSMTLLAHIRHLFSHEAEATVLSLPGGLDYWLTRDTEQVFEWSVTARQLWHNGAASDAQLAQMQSLFISILDYIDGSPNVHVDLPADTPLVADARSSSIGLLTVDPVHQVRANLAVDPPGYVDHIQLHVSQIARAPSQTSEIRMHVAHILTGLRNADDWLSQVRKDAVALFKTGQPDLAQLRNIDTGRLLDDMVNYATSAYLGKVDEATNKVQPAVIQAHHEMQQLIILPISQQMPAHW